MVTKKDLISEVSKKTGVSQKDVKQVFNCILDSTVEHVQGGETVRLLGFGSFSRHDRKGYEMKNSIGTGETVDVKPKSVMRFKPGAQCVFTENM